jgi:hypothetical protein
MTSPSAGEYTIRASPTCGTVCIHLTVIKKNALEIWPCPRWTQLTFGHLPVTVDAVDTWLSPSWMKLTLGHLLGGCSWHLAISQLGAVDTWPSPSKVQYTLFISQMGTFDTWPSPSKVQLILSCPTTDRVQLALGHLPEACS